MLDVLKKCFPDKIKSDTWQADIKEMIPSYGENLANDAELCEMIRGWTTRVLELID